MKFKFIVIALIGISNQPAYGQDVKSACLREVAGKLFNSEAVEVCKNANEYTVDCVKAASSKLFNSQVVEVCKNTTISTTSCINQTVGRMFNSQVVELCKNNAINRREEYVSCLRKYMNDGLTESTAAKICDR